MKKLFLSAMLATASATVAAVPSSYLDLGIIGGAGQYTFTTDGSEFLSNTSTVDTELGIWTESGSLIDQDDDGSFGFFSEISLNLAAGTYFLGMSEFNSWFIDDFINTGTGFEDGEVANMVLNINGSFAGALNAGAAQGYEENVFFKVEVAEVSEPGALALLALGLAGLNVLRRKNA